VGKGMVCGLGGNDVLLYGLGHADVESFHDTPLENPLRPLTEEERNLLARVSRSHAEPASHVARAKALLTVAEGNSYIRAVS
jgi:hypothetical protein